jgi:gas vesicle protein
MTSENDEQLLVNRDENIDLIMLQPPTTPQDDNAPPANTDKGYNLATIGIGAIVGAVVGAAAAALASKVTVESVNNTVKGVGDAVKGAASGVNNTVKGVGDAVKNVAENVDYTFKDVGTTVKGTAEELNQNVKGTVNVVKGTAQNVTYTVKGTVDGLKNVTEDVSQTVKNTVDAVAEQAPVVENKEVDTQKQGEPQTAYVLVPVDKDKFVLQNVPINGGTPVIPKG